MGNPMAAIMVNNLYQMSREFDYSDGDRPMYFIHAIRYLCYFQKKIVQVTFSKIFV